LGAAVEGGTGGWRKEGRSDVVASGTRVNWRLERGETGIGVVLQAMACGSKRKGNYRAGYKRAAGEVRSDVKRQSGRKGPDGAAVDRLHTAGTAHGELPCAVWATVSRGGWDGMDRVEAGRRW
jgi:hypothetical protein